MPQIDWSTFPSQIFWLLLCFGSVFCFVFYWLAPRLSEMILTRRKKMDLAQQDIEAIREQTEILRHECQEILKEARKEMACVLAEAEHKSEQEQRALQESLTLEIKEKLMLWEEDFRKDQQLVQNDLLERMGSIVAVCAQQMKEMAYDERVSTFLEEMQQSGRKIRH